MAYLTNHQISEMALAVLHTIEVSHISHARKVEIATDYAVDAFGVYPNRSAALLAVKLANARWEGFKAAVKLELETL